MLPRHFGSGRTGFRRFSSDPIWRCRRFTPRAVPQRRQDLLHCCLSSTESRQTKQPVSDSTTSGAFSSSFGCHGQVVEMFFPTVTSELARGLLNLNARRLYKDKTPIINKLAIPPHAEFGRAIAPCCCTQSCEFGRRVAVACLLGFRRAVRAGDSERVTRLQEK
jgi:hypothetical protein